MDKNLKKGLRRLAEDAEVGLARSILRWKYKRERGTSPGDDYLEARSRMVADAAREVIVQRGKKVIDEIRKVYSKPGTGEDSDQ
ncbi:MAG: hypothetical protein JRJ09_11935 [Deltaproteobacteria bacterium]|nr:hypothetical protein [Deltaproteobacteria bacterium]MBW2049218.1 hypothetical protein [Deltaproteobacteria bacterium]MBW2111944.1 hypothetical protein [Deltaproteobacteria bacterium]MBW2353487.1 hypothetical protein [Deltaproteobacteria bacterium]HDZ91821.1 hypothetical protein [Deltaproteobacteria bacterium]